MYVSIAAEECNCSLSFCWTCYWTLLCAGQILILPLACVQQRIFQNLFIGNFLLIVNNIYSTLLLLTILKIFDSSFGISFIALYLAF